MPAIMLPKRPVNHDKAGCGICERIKSDYNGIQFCEHCDRACTTPSSCEICRSGMKGLPDREED